MSLLRNNQNQVFSKNVVIIIHKKLVFLSQPSLNEIMYTSFTTTYRFSKIGGSVSKKPK